VIRPIKATQQASVHRTQKLRHVIRDRDGQKGERRKPLNALRHGQSGLANLPSITGEADQWLLTANCDVISDASQLAYRLPSQPYRESAEHEVDMQHQRKPEA
jgi:hypothetical protein